jgi:O-antigen/teichoic acid export membrane protein
MHIKKNILANLVGKVWGTLMSLLFVPLYIKFIGIEAYGLMGVFATLQVILGVLDMGLSTTLNRDLAMFSVDSSKKGLMVNMVKSFEFIYYAIAVVIGLVLLSSAGYFSTHWVNVKSLSHRVVYESFLLIALNFALQFPITLFQSGLLGLQKQVVQSYINIVITSLKGPGAILILWLISPTLNAFLIWQIVLTTLQMLLTRFYLWKALPASFSEARFDAVAVKHSGKFVLGLIGISLLSVVLTQSDKIILSKMVLLEDFGYYALASMIAVNTTIAISPVVTAVFPNLSQLIALNNTKAMHVLFHNACQLISALIIPLAISIIVFAEPLIFLWTHNAKITANAYPILQLLMVGTMMNSLMLVPYQLTLAHGWTRFGIKVNGIAILFFLPGMYIAVHYFGVKGGAGMWMLLNCMYIVFAMNFLFSRILKTEKWKWYLADVLKPLVGCAVVGVLFYLLQHYMPFHPLIALVLFGVCLASCFSLAAFVLCPSVGGHFLSFLKIRIPKKAFT